MLGTIIDQFNTKYDEIIKNIKKSDEQKSITQKPLLYSYQSYQTYVQTNEDGIKTIKKKSVVTENGETKKLEKKYVVLPDGKLYQINNQSNQLDKSKSKSKPKYKLKKITY